MNLYELINAELTRIHAHIAAGIYTEWAQGHVDAFNDAISSVIEHKRRPNKERYVISEFGCDDNQETAEEILKKIRAESTERIEKVARDLGREL